MLNLGGEINISGGIFKWGFQVTSGSKALLKGSEFYLDDTPIAGLDDVGNQVQIDVPADAILSGVFENGSAFLFKPNFYYETNGFKAFGTGTLTLETSAMPSDDPEVITIDSDVRHSGSRYNQTIDVVEGGTLSNPYTAVHGSTVNMAGGSGIANFSAIGSEVNLSSGSIGDVFAAYAGSTFNMTGGTLGNSAQIFSGSEMNVSGGLIGWGFYANEGSLLNVTGGTLTSLVARAGSEVNISGGRFLYDGMIAESGSDVKFFGSQFRLDGIPLNNLDSIGDEETIELSRGSLLTGVYQDGTPFLIEGSTATFTSSFFTLANTSVPTAPSEIIITTHSEHTFARHNQHVTIKDGASFSNSFLVTSDSEVDIQGGVLEEGFKSLPNSKVRISGGSIDGFSQAKSDSDITVTGGSVGKLTAYSNSHINIMGGSVGQIDAEGYSQVYVSGGNHGGIAAAKRSQITISEGTFDDKIYIRSGSNVDIHGGTFSEAFRVSGTTTIDIFGGSFGDSFSATGISVIHILGGTFGENFDLSSHSEIILSGSEFYLDGQNLAELTNGDTLLIDPSNYQQLTGSLYDGTAFSFEDFFPKHRFDEGAKLSIRILGNDILEGDYNDDGIVDMADYELWHSNQGKNGIRLANNISLGVIGQQEYLVWREAFQASRIPEPCSLSLLLMGLIGTCVGRRV